jgi:hypothetical protein
MDAAQPVAQGMALAASASMLDASMLGVQL